VEVRSDTGELRRDPLKRLAWIDTPKSKAVYGFLGEAGVVALDGLSVRVKTPFAVIALSSLTADPIHSSNNLLLTTVGRADNTGARYNAHHTERLDRGRAPILVEVIEAEIAVTAAQRKLTVASVNPEGFVTGTVPAVWENGVLRFTTGPLFPSLYCLLQSW
jgi:hypothetical protein